MIGKGWWEEEVIASRRKVPPFWHYSNFKRQFKRKEGLVGYKEGASYRILFIVVLRSLLMPSLSLKRGRPSKIKKLKSQLSLLVIHSVPFVCKRSPF